MTDHRDLNKNRVGIHGLAVLPAIAFVVLIIVLFSFQAARSESLPPTVQTDPADNNFLNQAALHGRITDTGGELCDERGFDWRPHSDLSWQSLTEPAGQYGNGSFSRTITGLNAGAVYAFRAKAHNSAGWSYGKVRTFRVIAIGTMVTVPANSITPDSAALRAKIVDDGGYNLGSRAFRYRKLGSYWTDLFEPGSFGPVVEFYDGFEDGTIDPFESRGDVPWLVDEEEFFLGNYSARSDRMIDKQTSRLAVQLTVPDDESTLRFAYRVSSQSGSDYLIFYVDEEEKARWSGESGWHEFSQAIPAGDHRLEWVYSKDESGHAGLDSAWVDEVRVTSPAYFGMSAANLEPGTTYEFFPYGYNPAGQALGDLLQFTTTTAVPTMSTGDAGSITWSGATLNGSIVAVNTPTGCYERGFEWRIQGQGDDEWQSWTESPGPYGAGSFSRAITGLASNTTYEVRSKAHNSVDWGYGNIKTFTTDIGPPSVRADPATNVTINSARLNGTIVDTGGQDCNWRGFWYKSQTDWYWQDPGMEEGQFPAGSFYIDVAGLTPGTTYEFYCYAHNSRGQTTSNILTFVTQAAPTVATGAASSITAGSATLNGSITDTGGVPCDERGFDWHKQGDSWQSWTEYPGPYGVSSFSHAITGLSPNVTYEFMAKAKNSVGWSYGSTVTFTTPALRPTVTTDPADGIGQYYGMLHGSITGIGGQACDLYEFRWHVPGESWNSWSQGQENVFQFGAGSFSYHCGPYDPGTTVEFRFRAHNSAGWTEGNTLTFTTLHPAVLRTDPASDITTTSVVLHGEILDTGGIDCDQRGFYVRKVGAPDWGGEIDYGNFPAGPYSKTMNGLDPGCDYEFMAYAYTPYTTANGYGDVLTFRTVVPPTIQTGPATDIGTTSADIHGLILDTGGENCDRHGFQWRRQGETEWVSWSENGDYSKDLRFSDDFEDGTIAPLGTGGAGYPAWIPASPGAGGSAYCAKSPAIYDNQTTYINCAAAQASTISFKFKVSSEAGYDCLIFKTGAWEVARWSGEQGWQNVTFEVPADQHYFEWWYQKDGSVSRGSDCAWIDDVRIETPFDLHLSGLDPATTYDFQAGAHNSTGWQYGNTLTFTTGGSAELDTVSVTSVTHNSATFNGEITSQGAAACDERGFDYRRAGQEDWQSWTDTGPAPFRPGSYSGSVSLEVGTTYSFRAKAWNSAGWSYGRTLTFETKDVPVMETGAATSVDHESAVLNGVIASTGGVNCTERGFQWRKQGETTWQPWTEGGSYSTDRLYSNDFEDGTLGTLYNDNNYMYLNPVWRTEVSDGVANTGRYCARSPVIPDAKLTPPGVILSQMILGFSPMINIPDDNYRIRFARAVSSEQDHDLLMFYIYTNNNTEPPFPPFPEPSGIWSGEVPWDTTISYPVPEGNNAFYWRYQKDVGHSGADTAWIDDIVIESTIPFSHKIDGLDMGTTYEFRSMAKNPVSEPNPAPDDYSYGPINTFTTAEYSVTQTDTAASVTTGSARLRGRITNTGGQNCDTRGFDWRRRGETGWHSWTEQESFGTGPFAHGLSELKPDVGYEFRAKAHNSAGWSFGGVLTFETLAPPPEPEPEPEPYRPAVSPQATWYLAEGSTAYGFDCYVSIVNPNQAEVTAQVTYMTGSGPVSAPDVVLPPASQATINPREVLGEADFSTRVVCREGKLIAVDRTMSWTGQGASSPEGHSSVGVTSPSKTWYLPEGSTNWGFETWLLIQNPNAQEASCKVTYMIEGKGPQTVNHTVPASSRKSFSMEADIGRADASIKVVSDRPVIPERAMYRNSRREGHDSIGTTSPASDFYLAEGTTAYGFTTYVLVQNPNDSATEVTLTYMTTSGPQPQEPFSMEPNSRKTVRVNDVPGMGAADFSTQVEGSQPIIAERAMYWDSGTGEACHDSVGMASSHSSFYLPDGQTSSGRETFTLVQNPNETPVTVEISYLTPTGEGNAVFTETIPANSRQTYNMADKGIKGRAAVMVTSKSPGKKIMCERAMYWNSRGAGTDTIGGYSD